MSTLSDIAFEHQRRREALTHRATVQSVRRFRQINVADLDSGWDAFAPALVADVAAAQVTAARQSAPYLSRVASSYGTRTESAALIPEAFGGIMLDGREVGPALYGAVAGTKTLIGKGMAPARAFEVGASFLATLVGAAVQDMGRQADNTLATGKGWTHYVRVVNAGACSRCSILAGKSDYRTAFLRHPRCKCTSAPIEGDGGKPVPDGLYGSPEEHFDSLSAAEQDRIYTKAGAYAIRNGADPISVVNARRGAMNAGGLGKPNRMVKTTIGIKADGSPLQVFLTGEGTTVRSSFGRSEVAKSGEWAKEGRYRRTTTLRLMPEQIQIMAGDNAVRARELLERYGYLR